MKQFFLSFIYFTQNSILNFIYLFNFEFGKLASKQCVFVRFQVNF